MTSTILAFLFLASCSNKNNSNPAKTASPSTNVVVTEAPAEMEESGSQKQSEESKNNKHMKYNEYDVTMEVDPERKLISGAEKLSFTNNTEAELDTIYFNIYLNAFVENTKTLTSDEETDVYIIQDNEKNNEYMNISKVTVDNEKAIYNIDGTTLEVSLPVSLAEKEVAEIVIHFTAHIPSISHRTGANKDVMWFGNFLPTLAVYENNEWQILNYYTVGEPFYSDISSYKVSVITPADYIVAATGDETSKLNKSDETRTTTITANLVRDFAFSISNVYTTETFKSKSGTYINIYHYSGLNNISDIKNAIIKAMDFYSENLGEYPYSSIDIVETDLRVTENAAYPQIIFFSKNDNNDPSYINSFYRNMGRQWFYNIVGSNNVTDPWLDNALIQVLLLEIDNDEKTIKKIMEAEYSTLERTLPILKKVKLSDDLSVYDTWENYYSIQITKSKLMVYSLRNKMGKETFYEFIKTYYNRFALKNASRTDFIEIAQDISKDDLTHFFDEWLYGDDLPPLND